MIINNNIYIRISILFCLGAITLMHASQVFGAEPGEDSIQSIIKISPVILKAKLDPGSKQIFPVNIENKTSQPMPIRITVEGFDPQDAQSGFSPLPPSAISPLAQWIHINTPESIIPAKSTQTVFVRITVPDTVPVGGYYAMIYVSPFYPGSTVTSKIGIVALANVGVQDSAFNKASISQFIFDSPLYEKNPLTVSFRVTNDALHYYSAKPTLTISPLWGKSDSVELDEKILLPGKSRSWKSVFSIQNSKWGIYYATLRISVENGESISKTIPVAVLPIKLIMFVIVSLSLVLFIRQKRRNIVKAIHILFTKTEAIDASPVPVHDKEITPSSPLETAGDLNPRNARTIDPEEIIRTVQKFNGSVTQAAKYLHIDRSTVYRWKHRADTSHSSRTKSPLARKSTKPHTLRSTSLSEDTVQKIVRMKSVKNMSTKEIINQLGLRISTRTIHRILKSHNLTRTYATQSNS